jgi:magnesium transporter
VPADMTLNRLKQVFDEKHYLAMPVVEPETHRLVGVVRAGAATEALNRESANIFLKFSGIVGGEEFRSMKLYSRSGRRLAWLSINIVLNLLAASVIAMYTDTLEAAIALAVFLPMISDMSGCSGSQAVAISMRELTLGLVRPREVLRVLGKELSVGIINGIVLGLLLGGVAMVWKGDPYIGLIVGSALGMNTIVAVCLGGSLPLILRLLRLDPAMVSGPILTTVTDMCGFFFVLSMATAMLDKLK